MVVRYPDDSAQSFIGTWWVESDKRELCPGRLVRAYLPHVDTNPYTLEVQGRQQPTEHSAGLVKLKALRAHDRKPPKPTLPLAALTQYDGEVFTVYRAKHRPAIVVSEVPPEIPKAFRMGDPKWQTSPTVSVVPAYGMARSERRAGWNPSLVERIRHAAFPQYMWDILPPGENEGSIIRFDHLQPLGVGPNSYQLTDYVLSEDALALIREWVTWLSTGRIPELLGEIRKALMEDSMSAPES